MLTCPRSEITGFGIHIHIYIHNKNELTNHTSIQWIIHNIPVNSQHNNYNQNQTRVYKHFCKLYLTNTALQFAL